MPAEDVEIVHALEHLASNGLRQMRCHANGVGLAWTRE